jgi:hypothetical protein
MLAPGVLHDAVGFGSVAVGAGRGCGVRRRPALHPSGQQVKALAGPTTAHTSLDAAVRRLPAVRSLAVASGDLRATYAAIIAAAGVGDDAAFDRLLVDDFVDHNRSRASRRGGRGSHTGRRRRGQPSLACMERSRTRSSMVTSLRGEPPGGGHTRGRSSASPRPGESSSSPRFTSSGSPTGSPPSGGARVIC